MFLAWIDRRVFQIIYTLLGFIGIIAIGFLILSVVPVKTIDMKQPMTVSPHTVHPGELIEALVDYKKYTPWPGMVTWTLEGKDDNGTRRQYVLLVSPTTNPIGENKRTIALVIWPQTKPGYYQVRQTVIYDLWGGLRKEIKYHAGEWITVVTK